MDALDSMLQRNAASAAIFGSSFNRVNADLEATRATIERLISEGVPLEEVIRQLGGRFNELSQISRDVQIAEDLISGLGRGVTQTMQSIAIGTQSVGDAFRNMGIAAASALADVVFQLLVIKPLIESVGGALGKSGGFAGLFGGFGFGGGVDPTHLFPDVSLGFAHGGTVPGLIGEPRIARVHGGEEIVPPGKSAGQIQFRATVQVNGDIIPRGKFTTPEDVVTIGIEQFDNRGEWTQVFESRRRKE